MSTRFLAASSVLGLATALVLSGCSSGGASGSDGSGAIVVVASTNVWGDIARQVGGDAVEVTSLISSPEQDPHSFEANANTVLTISKAKLVIENGGGYDDWMGTLVESHNEDAAILDAVEVSGKAAPEGGELNEHVWYDLPSAEKVADEIAAQLAKIAPGDAATFTANADAFRRKVDVLIDREATLEQQYAGTGIGITEPVPLYLTEALGLDNKTPAEFSEAIEEGDDVSPAVLKETEEIYTSKQALALVYNEQTSGPVTEQVKTVAEDSGAAVVPVTETMPEGLDYVGWMSKNLEGLASALG